VSDTEATHLSWLELARSSIFVLFEHALRSKAGGFLHDSTLHNAHACAWLCWIKDRFPRERRGWASPPRSSGWSGEMQFWCQTPPAFAPNPRGDGGSEQSQTARGGRRSEQGAHIRAVLGAIPALSLRGAILRSGRGNTPDPACNPCPGLIYPAHRRAVSLRGLRVPSLTGRRRRLALHCNAPLCATNCVVRMCGAPKGTPAVARAAAARAPILMAARAAACVRARSRRKGRLLELGAGVP
jgi:hypothetical protein